MLGLRRYVTRLENRWERMIVEECDYALHQDIISDAGQTQSWRARAGNKWINCPRISEDGAAGKEFRFLSTNPEGKRVIVTTSAEKMGRVGT